MDKTMRQIVKDLIKNSRPNSTESTLNNHISRLNSVANMMGKKKIRTINIFLKSKTILKKMTDLKLYTQRNYLSSLIVLLKSIPHDKFDKHLELYSKEMEYLTMKMNEENKKQKKNNKQELNWIQWEDLIHAVGEMNVGTTDYIICRIYTVLPPCRLEISKLLKKEPDDLSTKNYIKYENDKMFFILNDYKTVKHYGQRVISIPDGLQREIETYMSLNHQDSEYLFGKMSSTMFGRKIKRIIKDLMGVDAGVSMLRHSYISWKLKNMPALLELEKEAIMMGNSLGVWFNIYCKK